MKYSINSLETFLILGVHTIVGLIIELHASCTGPGNHGKIKN